MAEEAQWIRIQKKTFTRWANTYLKERMMKVDDLQQDLSDGVMLINLLEIISSKEIGRRYNKKPKIRTHKMENNLFALEFLKREGIKLVNIGNEDIVDCKLKLILGLIWTIILRYQIHIEEGKSARSDLLKWVRQQIPEYEIKNFTSNWNDGKAICALGNSLKNGICPDHWEKNPGNALENAKLGTDLAEEHFDIPKVLAPEDMVNPDVDELSVMTYISYFRDWANNEGRRAQQELLEKTPVASKCRAYGPGLERAETLVETEFTIEAINTFGRRCPVGGATFGVVIDGPNSSVVPDVADNGDGTYLVKYTPQEQGKHKIGVTLKDENINGSPFTVPVTRTEPDAKLCKVYGPGLEGGVVGQPGEFTIESYNRFGTLVPDGGDNYEVTVDGPHNSTVPAQINDNGNGKYDVVYTPIDNGNHTVNVNLNGAPVANSPYHLTVEKDPEALDSENCKAYGPGLEGGSTSEPSTFTVETRNGKGELVKKPGSPIGVEIIDPEGNSVDANIVDNNDGTFTVTYEPLDPGTFEVDVMLKHPTQPLYYDHIKDSPFEVEVQPGTDASKSIAYGPGLENDVRDTLPTHFTIESRDRYGNKMKEGGDPFQVDIKGPHGPVDSKVTDNGDGTYLVEYAPQDHGKHVINVDLKDKPVQDSPFIVDVKEGADASHSGLGGFTFLIQARTKAGKEKKSGDDNVKVSIGGEEAKVTDNGDGTYLVAFELNPESNTHKIDVTIDGKPIKGSPLSIDQPK